MLFARELDDFYVEIAKEKQEEFGQMHRVEPLTEEEIKRIQTKQFILNKSMREIKPEVKEYIEEYIFPSYERNEEGHGIKHIQYVIDRSFFFAHRVDNIDLNMVYVIAAYHDIGHYIDAKNHEKISAEMLLADTHLRDFFSEEQIRIMGEAVEDHRASSEREKPRSVYGEIVREKNGKLRTTKCDRTGCVFCGYGCHNEKEPNRFQRLKETHPKLWEYCMRDWNKGGLGMKNVLEYLGIKII